MISLDTYTFDCKNNSCKIWRELFTETCKQVIIMKRIKKTNKQKNKHNNFLGRNVTFIFSSKIVVNQNIILDIFRHVELTNGIVCRIEGFRG